MAGLSWHHLRVIRRTPLINQHNLALIPMHKARNGGKKGSKTGVFVFVHATAFRTKEGGDVVFGSLQHAYGL
jgi:hypothetical protein